jgi:cytochrome c oxidase subunit 3
MPATGLDIVAEPDELLFPSELETGHGGGNNNGPGDFDPGGHGGGGGDGDGGEDDTPLGVYRISLWASLTAIGTLFLMLGIAYVARSQMPKYWQPITLPRILWLSTAALLLSSVTCEAARRAIHHYRETAYGGWLLATAILGATFLYLQVQAWIRLAARGVFLSENPHSSFFYLFTAAHGLHLLGGIVALFYLTLCAWLPIGRRRRLETRREIADVITIFWHFMDGVWVGIFTLLLTVG